MSAHGPGVYEAEREVFGERFRGLDVALGLAEATELVHAYLPGWSVRRTRGRSGAGSTTRINSQAIALSQDAGLPIVLHEIAHGLSEHGHGLDFQRAFIAVVEKEMSPWWARRLRAAFVRHRCRGWQSLRKDGR